MPTSSLNQNTNINPLETKLLSAIDSPIWRPEDDLLGRDSLAKMIAHEIAGLDNASGGVLAITGPWGVGKTSLIKLVQAHLDEEKRVRTVWFNPWLFSGSNELVERFFQELSAQLKKDGGKLLEVAATMSAYGKVLTPLHSLPFIGGTAKGVSESFRLLEDILELREGGVYQQQEVLRKEMEELDTSILIVIDDIDRLEPGEIREIFKLVRLTGDFPNLIYLLAFDRERVERALSDGGLPGRDYIEKIVSIVHDVPEVPKTLIRTQVIDGLDRLLEGKQLATPIDFERLSLVYNRIIEPQIGNIRSTKRLLASIKIALDSLSSQVDPIDLIAIESVRIFSPDVLTSLSKHAFPVAAREDDINVFDTKRTDRVKTAIDLIMGSVGSQQHITRAVLELLFPIAWSIYDKDQKSDSEIQRYLVERRLAHRDIFELYLTRYEGPFLSAMRKAEQAFGLATDRERLDAFFAGVETSELEAVISALEELAENLPDEAVVPTSIVLLNLLTRVPDRRRKLHQMGPVWSVRRIIFLALVNSEERAREEIISRIYPELHLFARRRSLVEVADNQTPSGVRLVSKEFITQLTRRLAEDFRKAPADRLSPEPGLLWLAKWVQDVSRDEGPMPTLLNHCENAAVLLGNSIVENMRSDPDGDPRTMDVDTVIQVLGNRATLDKMMEICRNLAKVDEGLQELLPIAERSISSFDMRMQESSGPSSKP